jgi:hypothetical protein
MTIESIEIVNKFSDMFEDIDIDAAEIEELNDGMIEVHKGRMSWRIMDDDTFAQHASDVLDEIADMYEVEVQQTIDANVDYLASYVKFDYDMFRRDLEHDRDEQIATYDGTLYDVLIDGAWWYGWRQD